MMNMITKSLSIEIENFVKVLKRDLHLVKTKTFTKSAFVQCRMKINPEVFKHLSDNLITEFYTDNDDSIKLWRNFRLLSVDGSRLVLPNTKKLQQTFGTARNQTKSEVAQGRISVLYDVLNEFVIDATLSPVSTGERTLAIQHLKCAKKGDLILYDRGYPSFEMMHYHDKQDINFLFRAKIDFSNFTRKFHDSKNKTQIIKFYPKSHSKFSDKDYTKDTYVTVRLNKVLLPDGTIEILVSSLLDRKKYDNSLFKELYFKRWKVETFYDELKNKLKAEHLSGYSEHSIYQDFYSSIFVSNLQSLLVEELNDELAKNEKNTTYRYKVNANLSYGILKDRIIELFLSNKETELIIDEIKDLLKRHTIPIRPDRKYCRDVGKFRKREKPKVTKNQKDAF